jgi:hypothetical protein
VLDSSELFHVMVQRRGPRNDGPGPNQVVNQLRLIVNWTESENVYRRGMEYLALSIGPRVGMMTQATGVKTLTGWNLIWKLPEPKSMEGDIRFAPRSKTPVMEPLRMTKVDSATGPVPTGAGADADNVGPAPVGE